MKTTFNKYHALAIAIALVGTTAHAQNYSQTIFFGDSLTDTGRLKDIATQVSPTIGNALQPSFTTNPDPVWSSLLATSYGKTAHANTSTNPAGTNYAVGGARSGDVVNWNGVFTIPTTNQQILSHLASNHGKADPNALYAVWIGSNDLIAAAQATSTAAAQAAIANAVTKTAIDIETLNQTGATTILVPNVPDISLTPRAIYGESLQAGTQNQAKLAATLYNSHLFSALNRSSANVVPANTFALLQEATRNATAFGFKNTTGVACQMPNRTNSETDPASTSLACTPSHLVEANANETYVFADDIHPAGKTHRILAQYYRSILDAPHAMARLPQSVIATGSKQDRNIARQLDGLDKHTHALWADVSASQDSDVAITLGLDTAGKNSHTGAYISHQEQDSDLSKHATAQTKHIGLGLYHRHDIGNIRLKAQAGIDRLSIDTHRQIAWEGEQRIHTGEATGRRTHAGLQLSYGANVGNITLRPYVGANAQKVRIDDLLENNPSLSTAMQFGSQSQKSLQGEAGVDIQYALNDKTQLLAGVGVSKEFNDDARIINASLSSIGEYTKGFNTAINTAKDSQTHAHVGAKFAIGKANLNAKITADHHNSQTDVGGGISVQMAF